MRWKAAFLCVALMAPATAMADPILDTVPMDHAQYVRAHPLTVTIGGRTSVDKTRIALDTPFVTSHIFQWPGVYFEAGFKGSDVYFLIDSNSDRLKVSVDGKAVGLVEKPAAGQYHIGGLDNGPHTIRIDKISENQGLPSAFAGFAVPPAESDLPPPARTRQIEFIGDSLTVGFGNTSPKTECSQDEIWATTDTSQAWGPVLARSDNADYRIEAISGRGMVRNFNGVLPGETVPALYPYDLFDKAERDASPAWQPQIVVVALGTNDFSTPVHAGEAWADDDALRDDYETGYATFVMQLRAKYPSAFFLLVSYDGAAVQDEVAEVVDVLKAGGESKVEALPLNGFAMTGCAGHLTTDDDQKAATALGAWIDAHPGIWPAG